MNFNNLIKQVNNLEIPPLSHISSVGILPNDGGVIDGFPESVLSFNDSEFRLHIFRGFLKPKFEGEIKTFLFNSIKEIEMGKYNLKDRYIKIVFKDDKFIAFSYVFKVRKYPNQQENIMRFIMKLENISKKEKEKTSK